MEAILYFKEEVKERKEALKRSKTPILCLQPLCHVNYRTVKKEYSDYSFSLCWWSLVPFGYNKIFLFSWKRETVLLNNIFVCVTIINRSMSFLQHPPGESRLFLKTAEKGRRLQTKRDSERKGLPKEDLSTASASSSCGELGFPCFFILLLDKTWGRMSTTGLFSTERWGVVPFKDEGYPVYS